MVHAIQGRGRKVAGVWGRFALVLVLLLAGCGSGGNSTPTTTPTATVAAPAPTTTAITSPTATATPAGGGLASERVAAFRQFADAVNGGDVAGALQVFTDDVVWERGGQCPAGAGTCVGKQAVQREVTRDVMAHHKLTLLNADTSGAGAVVRLELRNDGTQRANVDRVVQLFALEVRGDQIAAVRVTFDLTDRVTASFVAAQAGSQR